MTDIEKEIQKVEQEVARNKVELRELEMILYDLKRKLEKEMAFELNENLVITKDHIKLLKRLEFEQSEPGYYAIGTDVKCPFGDSDVRSDVRKILGRKISSKEFEKLMKELPLALNKLIEKFEV